MKSYKFFIILSAILFISFYFFSKEVKRGFLKNMDFNVTVKIQDKLSSKLRLDGWLEDSGILASPVVTTVAVLILTGWGVIAVKGSKKKLAVLIMPLAFAGIVAGEIYGKSVVHHPAPSFFMIKHPTTIFPTYYINEEYSYPSGHAARAVFLAIISWGIANSSPGLERRLKKRRLVLTLGLALYVGVISVSRIYLGHHWLSDVLGGLLLGGGMGVLCLTIVV